MKDSKVKTVGILTSGGDAPGLNAAIRGLCLTGMNEYGMKFVGIQNGYRGFENGQSFQIKRENLDGLLMKGGTFLGSTREKPFKSQEKLEADVYAAAGPDRDPGKFYKAHAAMKPDLPNVPVTPADAAGAEPR